MEQFNNIKPPLAAFYLRHVGLWFAYRPCEIGLTDTLALSCCPQPGDDFEVTRVAPPHHVSVISSRRSTLYSAWLLSQLGICDDAATLYTRPDVRQATRWEDECPSGIR